MKPAIAHRDLKPSNVIGEREIKPANDAAVRDTGAMPSKTYAICSVCKVSKRLGDNGLMKLHTRHGARCDGSCLPPQPPKPRPGQNPRARLPGTDLRRAVLERDAYRCKKCGWHSSTGSGLEMNHVATYAEGGETTLDNLDTLCATCHAELSWLWVGEPPVAYATWLTMAPAVSLIRMLMVIDGEICVEGADWIREQLIGFTGITPEVAKALLYPKRPP